MQAGVACATGLRSLPQRPALKGAERQRPLNAGRGRLAPANVRARPAADAVQVALHRQQQADTADNVLRGCYPEIAAVVRVCSVAEQEDF